MSTLARAIAIAAQAHESQVDKAGAPYILHPLRMMLALPPGDARIVAVLHDVIEDTSVTVDDLRRDGFSERVLEALASVTKRNGEDYMAFVRRAGANPVGRLVKLADLADNCDLSRIADPQQRDFDRIAKYRAAAKLLDEGAIA